MHMHMHIHMYAKSVAASGGVAEPFDEANLRKAHSQLIDDDLSFERICYVWFCFREHGSGIKVLRPSPALTLWISVGSTQA